MSALAPPLDLLIRRGSNPRPLLVDASRPPARVELSGRVLANWWAKDLGLLSTEFSLGPGDRVEVRAAASWRTIPLVLAALTLGATVSEGTTDPEDADLVMADRLDDEVLAAPEVLAVATEPLALDFGTALPAGVVDHAAEVRAYPDQPMFDASAAASSRLSPTRG
ncbi:MAG: TIGR03089 family protein, partial [Galactobacter sp.]